MNIISVGILNKSRQEESFDTTSASSDCRCPMTMQKNWRQYIGTVSRGEAKRLQGDDSDVSQEIPPGLPGVYICRVHADHTRFTRYGIVPESECIVGPFVEFKFKRLLSASEDEIRKTPEAFYEISIPHCISDHKHWKDVKVRHGDDLPGKDNQQVVFQEVPPKANGETAEMYYEMDEHFIKNLYKEVLSVHMQHLQ